MGDAGVGGGGGGGGSGGGGGGGCCGCGCCYGPNGGGVASIKILLISIILMFYMLK